VKTKSPIRIGFLGGGQLARMMILEAHRLGYVPHVYSSDERDPAAQVLTHSDSQWTRGYLNDFSSLLEFAQSVDHLTFESEFVPTEALLEIEKTHPEKIFPRPSLMLQLQTRLTQKQLLKDFRIPTSPFCSVSSSEGLSAAWEQLGGPFVLKVNFGGYDGYGTYFARKLISLRELEEKVKTKSQLFMAEKLISFKRETAAILVRGSSGNCFSLPLVETFQHMGKCDWVRGPISHQAWPALEKKLKQMMKKLDYVGALGVEMFDTGSELLVNELAPRVHNSGHYSQNALTESQFSLHIRAGCGEKIQAPQLLTSQFVMTNLIGTSSRRLQAPLDLTGALHLYGKAENRPGRKMGHVNYVAGKTSKASASASTSASTLLKKALNERKRFQL
jgi:5-(carboxyamino)imidazole ribonucleotide synthase